MNIEKLTEHIEDFAKARDWEQFHTIKNLAMALSVESSELVEIFQWLSAEEAERIDEDPVKLSRVREELADIFVYLLKISGKLNIDLEEATFEKMAKNAEKYPVERSKGNATKYNEFK